MIGGLGIQELLIVFIIALVLFGGKKLPEVGQNLGKALRGFRQAEEETRRELEDAVKEPSNSTEETTEEVQKDGAKTNEVSRNEGGDENPGDDEIKEKRD